MSTASTIGCNLLPGVHVEKVRRRAATRRWVRWLSVYSTVVVAIALVATQLLHVRNSARASLDHLEGELATLRQAVEQAEKDVADQRRLVSTARLVSDHADFSILLAHIAHLRGDSLVLEQIDLRMASPRDAQAPRASAAPHAPYTLEVAGVAGSLNAVTSFLQGLEGSGVFVRVALQGSEARPRAEDLPPLTRFRIACELGEPQAVRTSAEARP